MNSVQGTPKVPSVSIRLEQKMGGFKTYAVREQSGVITRWIGPTVGVGPVWMQFDGDLVRVVEPSRFGDQFGFGWLHTFYATK